MTYLQENLMYIGTLVLVYKITGVLMLEKMFKYFKDYIYSNITLFHRFN